MLLVTGEPNLVGQAELYAGQSRNASGTMFDPQDVKNSLNSAYQYYWDKAKELHEGWAIVTAFINAVVGQIYYTYPITLEGRIETVELQEDGLDLSAAPASDTTILHPSTQDSGLLAFRQDLILQPRFYFFQHSETDGKQIGIVSPPPKTGTNSIRILFEESLTLLSADGDTPIFPTSHHDMLAMKAAIYLKAAKEMPFNDLAFLIQEREDNFINRMSDVTNLSDHQMAVAGTAYDQNFATTTGFNTRSVAQSHDRQD